MTRRAWTPEEDAIVTRNYARSGAKGAQAILQRHGYTRTLAAIRCRADRLSISAYEAPTGYVPTAWLAPEGGAAALTVRKAARADGALREQAGPVRWIVPQAWADAYARILRDRIDAHDLEPTWWTVEDIANATGLTLQRAQTYVNNPKCILGRVFQNVESRYTHYPRRRLFHPDQAAEAVAEYRQAKAA